MVGMVGMVDVYVTPVVPATCNDVLRLFVGISPVMMKG